MRDFTPNPAALKATQIKRDKEAALLEKIEALGLRYDRLLRVKDWAGIRELAGEYRKLGKGAAFSIAVKLERMAAQHGK